MEGTAQRVAMTPFHELERVIRRYKAPVPLLRRLFGPRLYDYPEAVRPGATAEALREFEAANHVSLPADVRMSYLYMDGTDGYTSLEHAWVRLWPVAEWSLVFRELPTDDSLRHAPYSSCYAFADHGIWSWCYGIHLPSPAAPGGEIYEFGATANSGRRVARSFSEFMHLVLSDSDALFK